jgi:hypothetical protein
LIDTFHCEEKTKAEIKIMRRKESRMHWCAKAGTCNIWVCLVAPETSRPANSMPDPEQAPPHTHTMTNTCNCSTGTPMTYPHVLCGCSVQNTHDPASTAGSKKSPRILSSLLQSPKAHQADQLLTSCSQGCCALAYQVGRDLARGSGTAYVELLS